MKVICAAILAALCFSAASAAKVTFRVGAFPAEGESLAVKLANQPLVALEQEIPYPLYSVTLEVANPDELTFVFGTVNDKTFTSESKGEWNRDLSTATKAEDESISTLNDFLGDKNTRNGLKRMESVHAYDYTLESHPIYDETTVSTVNLDVDQAEFDQLLKDSNHPKGYFNDTNKKPKMKGVYTFFNADSKYHAKEVTIGQAGFGSLVQRRKSFNVKFHKDDHHAWGLRKHKLKAMTFDPSLMREYATLDVLTAMGLPTHRIAWTRFFVNGKYVGIYNNLETITKKYLHERFPESAAVKADGSFYKCNDKAWLTPSTVELCALDDDFPETPADRSDLMTLAKVLQETPEAELEEKVSAIMDVDQALKMMATELTLLRRDAYFDDGSNYVMWKNSKTGKFQYLIFDHEINMFDMDVAPFDKPFSFFKVPWLHTKVFLPASIPEIPLTRLITAKVPAWQKLYRQYVTETAELMGSQQMTERLTSLHAAIRPMVAIDPTYGRDMAYTVEDFDNAFFTHIEKSKGDILLSRYLNLKGLVPDLLHSDIIDVEMIGLLPFMAQRSSWVKSHLAGDDGPQSETCTDAKSGDCIFPFVYKKFTYQACTTAGHGNAPWCPTRQVLGKTVWWSTCDCGGKTAEAEAQESLLS